MVLLCDLMPTHLDDDLSQLSGYVFSMLARGTFDRQLGECISGFGVKIVVALDLDGI